MVTATTADAGTNTTNTTVCCAHDDKTTTAAAMENDATPYDRRSLFRMIHEKSNISEIRQFMMIIMSSSSSSSTTVTTNIETSKNTVISSSTTKVEGSTEPTIVTTPTTTGTATSHNNTSHGMIDVDMIMNDDGYTILLDVVMKYCDYCYQFHSMMKRKQHEREQERYRMSRLRHDAIRREQQRRMNDRMIPEQQQEQQDPDHYHHHHRRLHQRETLRMSRMQQQRNGGPQRPQRFPPPPHGPARWMMEHMSIDEEHDAYEDYRAAEAKLVTAAAEEDAMLFQQHVTEKQYWFEILSMLVEEYQANVNYFHIHTGETALYIACSYYCIDIIRYLLHHGANPNIYVPRYAPCHYPTDIPTLSKIVINTNQSLAKSATITTTTTSPPTATMTPNLNERVTTPSEKKTIDPANNAILSPMPDSTIDRTPLLFHVCFPMMDSVDAKTAILMIQIVELLLQYHANPNIYGRYGTPLLIAMSYSRHRTNVKLQLYQLLLRYHGDINIQDHSTMIPNRKPIGDTILHVIGRFNHYDIIPLLLQYEPDIYQSNHSQQNPFDTASSRVKVLLEQYETVILQKRYQSFVFLSRIWTSSDDDNYHDMIQQHQSLSL